MLFKVGIPSPSSASSLALVASLLLTPPRLALAQHSGSFGQSSNPANNNAYFTSADYTVAGDLSGADVFLGKTDTDIAATNFQTYTPSSPITLTMNNARVTYAGGNVDSQPLYPDGSIHPGISVFGGNTLVLNYTGSEYVSSFDTSVVQISNSNISHLNGYGSSTIAVSGTSSLGQVASYDSSTINVYDGYFVGGQSFANSTINIYGGNNPGSLRINQNSTVKLYGGNLTSCDIYDSGNINVSGGTISYIFANNTSTVDIRGLDGGNIATGGGSGYGVYLNDSNVLNLYGTGFSATPIFANGLNGFAINGTLANGFYLNDMDVYVRGNSAINFLSVTVPEPSSLFLMTCSIPVFLAMGSTAYRLRSLRRDRRHRSGTALHGPLPAPR